MTCSGSMRQGLEQVPTPFLRSSVRPTKSRSASFSTSGMRAEELRVGAVVDHRHVLLGDAEVALDLGARGLAHRDDAIEPGRDPLLHEEREVERALDLLRPGFGSMVKSALAIDVERMVDDRDYGSSHGADARAGPSSGTGCRTRCRSGVAPAARFQRRISRRSPKVCISGKTPKRETPSSHSAQGLQAARRDGRGRSPVRVVDAEDVVVGDDVERDSRRRARAGAGPR